MSPPIIDTWPAAEAACARLRAHRLLALDMEGAPLETHTSLLQLAVSPQEIYIFDVQTLGQALFDAEHLLPILSDPSTLKLCYDCRGDGSALFHQHGVRAYGLYDLQIAYTSLRIMTPSALQLEPRAVPDAFLKGLHCAVAHLLPPDEARAFAQRKREWKREWRTASTRLLQRPLADDALVYAAADVEHLFAMHRAWSPFFANAALVAATDARMLKATSSAAGGDSDDSDDASASSSKALIDFPLVPPLVVSMSWRHRPNLKRI